MSGTHAPAGDRLAYVFFWFCTFGILTLPEINYNFSFHPLSTN